MTQCVPPTMMKENLESAIYTMVKKNQIYRDPIFNAEDPKKGILFGTPRELGAGEYLNSIEFKRPSELFVEYEIFGKMEPNNIRQGDLSNRYFIAALSLLCERPGLITRLFDLDISNNFGMYVVWLNINGIWEQIILDDKLPVYMGKGSQFSQAFAHSIEGPQIWPSLLEKAYAKAYGSYNRIATGNIFSALKDLTGAPYVKFKDVDKASESELSIIFQYLEEAQSKDFISFASIPSTGQHDEEVGNGLITGHTYSIIGVGEFECIDDLTRQVRNERLVQIRNPWNNTPWRGEWDNNSPKWRLSRDKGFVHTQGNNSFWMTLKEFTYYFDSIGVLMIRPDDKHNAIQLNPESTTAIRFKIATPGEYTFSVDQKDQKSYSSVDDNSRGIFDCYVRITICKLHKDGTTTFKGHKIQLNQHVFINNKFDEGEYLAMIEPYYYSRPSSYVLSSYGPEVVNMELWDANKKILNLIEYSTWLSFAHLEQAQTEFKKFGKHDLATSPNLKIYRIRNNSHVNQLLSVRPQSALEAFETITSENGAAQFLTIEPESYGLIIEKKNPLFTAQPLPPLLQYIDGEQHAYEAPDAVMAAFQYHTSQIPVSNVFALRWLKCLLTLRLRYSAEASEPHKDRIGPVSMIGDLFSSILDKKNGHGKGMNSQPQQGPNYGVPNFPPQSNPNNPHSTPSQKQASDQVPQNSGFSKPVEQAGFYMNRVAGGKDVYPNFM